MRPDVIPQLADADELCKGIDNNFFIFYDRYNALQKWLIYHFFVSILAMFDGSMPEVLHAKDSGMQFAGLVPNLKGYDRFCESGLDTIEVLTSATEAHSMKNVKRSRDEMLKENCKMIEMAGIYNLSTIYTLYRQCFKQNNVFFAYLNGFILYFYSII